MGIVPSERPTLPDLVTSSGNGAHLNRSSWRAVRQVVPVSSPLGASTPTHDRPLLVFGPLVEVEGRTLRAAASALGVEALFFDSPSSLAADLEHRLPIAVAVGVDCDGSLEVLAHLRGNVRYAAIPLRGLTGEGTDLAFGTFYQRGGDDLVSAHSLRALVSRLRPLVQSRPAVWPTRPSGSAVVATSDLGWRNVVARTLSNAGIEPKVVGNGPDATDAACGPGLFILASDDLPPEGATTALAGARARGSTTPWVIAARPNSTAALRESLGACERVTVVDRFMPPDNLLFTANELRRPQIADQRTSPRVLFGTAVAFRFAGGAEDDHGFTYNVSSGGVFVRTLAPPDAGQEVWLEMWPPRTDRTVRLVGRVAWRRAFGPHESATVPPGFGVQLTGGLSGDLDVWEAGCRKLIADRSAPPLRADVWERLSSAPPPWFPKAIV